MLPGHRARSLSQDRCGDHGRRTDDRRAGPCATPPAPGVPTTESLCAYPCSLSRATLVRRSEPGSSAHQGIENATQRLSINVAIDPDAMSATKIDLDDALAPPSTPRRRHQRRFGRSPRRHRRPNLDRHERRHTRLIVLAKLLAPPEQLAHMKAGHASHLGNSGSGLQRCGNQPFLLILRPPTPPLDRSDHLCPRNRHSASPRITPRTCSARVRQSRRPSSEEYVTSRYRLPALCRRPLKAETGVRFP